MSYGKPIDCPTCGTALVETDRNGRFVECRACHTCHDLTEVKA